MNNPFISIIVPVYNVEKYLIECLDSIVRQNYKEYEVILVDDGSSDGCPAICDDYVDKYQFRVIHQANAGLSAARNTGIKAAVGEYLLFCDSDDFLIEVSSLEMIAESLLMSHPDLLICLPDEYDESGKNVIYHHKAGNWSEHTAFQGNTLVDPLYRVNGIWVTLAQTKIIRREFCIKLDLLFFEGIYHEDDEWIARVLLSDPKIAFLYHPWYGYRHRDNSIVSSIDNQKVYKRTCDQVKAAFSMLSHPDAKRYKEYVRYASDYLLNTIISAKDFSDEQLTAFLSYIKNYRSCYKTILFSKDLKLSIKALYVIVFGEKMFINKYKG